MTAILLDTNAYSAFKRSDRDAVEIVHQSERIGISIITIGELFYGFCTGSRERDNRQELLQFLNSPRLEVIVADLAIADRYAALKAQLKGIGRPIPANDIWIAATALEHGFDIFSYDAHFRLVPGLKVGTKLADFDSG